MLQVFIRARWMFPLRVTSCIWWHFTRISVRRPTLLETCHNINAQSPLEPGWHDISTIWLTSCLIHSILARSLWLGLCLAKRITMEPITITERVQYDLLSTWISLANRPLNFHSMRLSATMGFRETYSARWQVLVKVQCLADSRWWQVFGETLARGNTVSGRSWRGRKSRWKERMGLNVVVFSRSPTDTKEPRCD